MKDPLAGKREALNRAELGSPLVWPDTGHGCPVEQGQTFMLRTCWIEITGVRRAQEGRDFVWRAGFVRHRRNVDRPHFLTHGPGTEGRGYVHDPRTALAAQDLPTLDPSDPDDPAEREVRALMAAPEPYPVEGDPPEPEAVDPDEIADYTGSREARQRYLHDQAEARAALSELPVELRLAKLRQLAREKHIDISKEERVIERRLAALERRLLDAA